MRNLIIAAALIGSLAAPTLAQTPGDEIHGVFDQASSRNPFNPLLAGRWTFAGAASVSAGNNTLNVGDAWAIQEIAASDDGFRGSDLFLIAGLVPAGQGARFSTHDFGGFTIAAPFSFATIGITVGARSFGQGILGENISVIGRNGFTGDRLSVDFADTGARVVGFSDLGVLALFGLPEVQPGVNLRLGLGAHYLYGLANTGLRFGDGNGGGTTFAIDNDGVDSDLVVSSPNEFEIGGNGFAVDGYLAANFNRGFFSALISNVGALSINTGSTEERRIVVQNATVGEFLDSLDAMEARVVPSRAEDVALPTEYRVEASYEVHRMLSFGAAYTGSFGGDFSVASPFDGFTGLAEIRPLRFLPLRIGAHGGGDFGSGFVAGAGFRFHHIRTDIDLTTTGGFKIDEVQTGALRTSFAIQF